MRERNTAPSVESPATTTQLTPTTTAPVKLVTPTDEGDALPESPVPVKRPRGRPKGTKVELAGLRLGGWGGRNCKTRDDQWMLDVKKIKLKQRQKTIARLQGATI